MKLKKITMLLLAGAMTAGLAATGCGAASPDKTVATVNETPIPLGLANFSAQYTAVDYDTYYMAYFGDDMWTEKNGDDGTTLTDSVKENTLDALKEYYLLEEHMSDYGVEMTAADNDAIDAAVSAFMSANTAQALDTMGAEETYVREFLRLNTLQKKMYNAIVADVDTNVTDEECAQKTFSYVRISKAASDDDTEEVSEEQAAADAKTKAEKILTAAQTKSAEDSLETAAKDNDANKSTCSYGASDLSEDDNSTYLELEVLQAADRLADGEMATELIETDKYYYVLRMDNTNDTEAAERERESIINDRKTQLYQSIVNSYKESAQWTVDEDVWKPVNFDTLYTKQKTTADTTTDTTADSADDAADTETDAADDGE